MSGCAAKDCTEEYIPGVDVTVKDALSGATVCDATVTFTHDGHDEIVTKPFSPVGSPTACSYQSGMYGGDVRVLVKRDGYADQTVSTNVPTGDCGPNGSTKLDVALQK